MDYIGEHLWPGRIGHFFIILSFVASLVATIAYFYATTTKPLSQESSSWKKIARIAFILETISILAIFITLFFIIYNHLFEYKYAWQHSSRTLEMKYLLSCFWEGQEGSFLLWSFWHCILGLFIIKGGKEWEAPVMVIVSIAQVYLATTVLGMYFFGYKLGSNPFILLRDSGLLDNAPSLHLNFDVNQPIRPDYMASIRDGNDLNPLLQNYWMVIHPPVLFLGFAATIIPFAYAVAGLWLRKTDQWLKPALPWTLFALASLGIGIMMGGAWAYESLNFGGYWAWDPVENASLVPWLILVAGVHTLLIYRHSGHSLRTTYVFLILQFLFIIYSTFLTRSGILGDSSVHSFTDLGMNVQLYFFLFLFIWGTAVLIAPTYKFRVYTALSAAILGLAAYLFSNAAIGFLTLITGVLLLIYMIQSLIPAVQKEEQTSSREFWMFIGSLVLFLSAMVIIAKTSLPVLNAVFGTNFANPEDPEFAYNSIQVYVAIIIALLTAVTQYLKYKKTGKSYFFKKIGIPTLIAVVFATLLLVFGGINYQKYGIGFLAAIWIAAAASIYAIIANLAYIWIGLKGKLNISGGSIAHFGFGLTLLGILLSSGKKEILSYNTSGIAIDFGEESTEKTGENLTLVKGVAMKMGKFDVTYMGDSVHQEKKDHWFYKVHFKSREDNEEFTLTPNAFVNYKGNEGLMANPSSKHYWNHDIFTYISALPNPEKNKDTANFVNHSITLGDSIFYSKGYILVENVTTKDNLPFDWLSPDDKASVATIKVQSINQTSYSSELVLIKDKQGNLFPLPDTIMSESLVLQLTAAEGNQLSIDVKESNAIMDYVTLKAYKFPWINVLWLGIIVTTVGTYMSMFQRRRELKNKLQKV